MDKTLQLKIITALQDKLSGPLKKIIGASGESAKSLKELRGRLKELESTQRRVGQFRELSKGLREADSKLQEARERVSQLAREMRNSAQPTAKMRQEFDKAVNASRRLNTASQEQAVKLRTVREKLKAAGVATLDMGSAEQSLRTNITRTTEALRSQEQQLGRVTQREKKLAAARSAMHATHAVATNLAVGGYATRTAGTRVLGGLGNTLTQSKAVENETVRIRALGIGEGASAKAVSYARGVRQKGTSVSDNVQLMRDAMTIFADEHHAQMVLPTLAKMKFANEAVYGAEDAQANEEKFMNMLKVIELRGGTKDLPSFNKESNMVQKVLTATGGRVGGDQWREFIQRGGVAAKQLRPDAFYYQMEPLIQEMGGHQAGTGLMSAYSNLYQGKTTVRAVGEMMKYGLVDPKMVEYTKIGTVKRVQPGALVGGELFKASPLEWIEQVLLPKLAAKGVTDRGAINDAISSMITNRTGANLFTTMVMQAQQIHKNERLNKGADDINALAQKAETSTQGHEVELLAKLRDLKLELGEKVSPIYNAALEKTAALTDKVVSFMKEHSSVATALVAALAVLGGVLAVGGTLSIALASILVPMALVKFSLTALGVKSGLASRGIRLIAQPLLWVGGQLVTFGRAAFLAAAMNARMGTGLIGLAARAIPVVIGGIRAMSLALLTTPIGLIIGAIGMAALLIYEYWDPLKAYFSDLWDQVTAFFSSGTENILKSIGLWLINAAAAIINWSPIGAFYTVFAAVMTYFGVELPAKFTDFGAMMMQGLINGIKNMAKSVKSSITEMASSTVGWFKDKLGINSPSRIFIGMGGNISEGAALGIQRQQGLAEKAAQLMAAGVMAAAVVSPATAALAQPQALRFDSRPSISAGVGGAGLAGQMSGVQLQGDHVEIHIHAAADMRPQDIAQAVARELDRRERDKMARARSALTDYGN